MSMNGAGAPQLVPPQPCPSTVQIGQATGPDGKLWIVLQVHSPTGTHVTYLEGGNARVIGKELVRLADAGQLLLAPKLPGDG
jgi:hypothetical protein